jgi:flavodoxin
MTSGQDDGQGATIEEMEKTGMRTTIVLASYHHLNTDKVARAMAKVLDARVVSPGDVDLEDLGTCDLIGFGSGIYDAKHHLGILNLADRLPEGKGKMTFIFSTSAIMGENKVARTIRR